jgi:hypothetical protein
MGDVGSAISIVHYHFERGGVTQVVDLSVRAMAEHLPALREIRLVSGRSGGAESLAERLAKSCAKHGVEVTLHVIPEMDYLPIEQIPGADSAESVDRLKRALMDACDGSVWMIHNYHLGKNPLFTAALLEIAKVHPEQRLCFYIHDFPECARYENLRFLRKFVPESPYPEAGNVRYVVINERDRVHLTVAGIPDRHIVLVNNPVEREAIDHDGHARDRQKLEAHFAGHFPGYTPGAPLLIYPIRTIRRKNVLELGLIASLSPTPVNLVVTLPGTSETEIDYSNAVSAAFTEGLIPGMWGVGEHLDQAGLTFMDLMGLADIIVSSSVQEGFGYLFVNAVQWGRPLFARYLDVLDGIRPVFEGHPHHFYTSLRVPITKDNATALKERYVGKVRGFTGFVDQETVDRLTGEIETVIDDHTAEFSYLPLESQLQTLRNAEASPEAADEIAAMNPETLNGLAALVGRRTTSPVGSPVDREHWLFSFEAYAESVRQLLASFESPRSYRCPPLIQSNLVKGFAGIEYLRLIYAN